MAHYNITQLDDSELLGWIVDQCDKVRTHRSLFLYQEYRFPNFDKKDIEGSNAEIKYLSLNNPYFTYNEQLAVNYRFKLDKVESANTCLIKCVAKVFNDDYDLGDTYDYYILASNKDNSFNNKAIDVTLPFTGSAEGLATDNLIFYNDDGTIKEAQTDRRYQGPGVDNNLVNFDSAAVDHIADAIKIDNDSVTYLKLVALDNNFYISKVDHINAVGCCCGLIVNPINTYNSMAMTITELPDWLPVFEVTDYNHIINYLLTGDDTGKIDPFDPSNPPIEEVTDFSTDFYVYLSSNDSETNKLSVLASNGQFNEYIEQIVGAYGLYYDTTLGYDTSKRKFSGSKTPTITTNFEKPTGTTYAVVYFGERDLDSTSDNHSGCFKITFAYSSSSESHMKITEVGWYPNYYSSAGYGCSRTSIVNGFRYTCPQTNDTLTFKYTNVNMEDLKEAFETFYPEPSDKNNNQSGEIPGIVVGNGLKTYKLTDNLFKSVNQALWNTDWTTVFKSNTIDPIKAVISCKGIPFDVSGTGTDTVYLANQSIDATGAVTVNPIRKIECGTYSIAPIYGNFIDIAYTKVHVYLPYIGWIELPASEVVSRVAVPKMGIMSKLHHLKFTYLVDFVDGQCRCIISCDGSERWYFDGNCSIDIPVTSDNHTAAVSNAIKSGVATVMSVATAVAGAYTGNAIAAAGGAVSAIQNAPNVIPTYNFSATASSSGYINNAMNKHIMIVLEYPNAFYPNGFVHEHGYPTNMSLTLGTLKGYTKTVGADVFGIDCTQAEADMIASYLDSGVFL